MFLVKDIKLSVGHSDGELLRAAALELGTYVENITEYKLIKKSIDARKKKDIKIVYSLAVKLKNKKGTAAQEYKEAPALKVPKKQISTRPIIVGMGPAGLFAALILAESGCRPIILERGKSIEERKRDVLAFQSGGALCADSNVQFGEGGAGTFSDGKLTTGIKSPYIKEVYEAFVKAGADESILYSAKPHIGSDILEKAVASLRKRLIDLGAEIHFSEKLEDIELDGGQLRGVKTNKGFLKADTLFLATGHSARDTYKMLYEKGIKMEAKPFSVGARIEHLQKSINRAQYGAFADMLPAADYKLSCHLPSGISVYTFCMCPGGYVSASSSEEGAVVTNGYSLRRRDGVNANSAILASVSDKLFESPMAAIEFQREIERKAYLISGSYKAPCQRAEDFLLGRPTREFGSVQPSYRPGVVMGDISSCLPSFVTDALRQGIVHFAKSLPGFDAPDALLTAPETRSSAPVRILRGEDRESSIKGIYPIGEGSGYAGGITSSAVDAIKSAMMFLDKC